MLGIRIPVLFASAEGRPFWYTFVWLVYVFGVLVFDTILAAAYLCCAVVGFSYRRLASLLARHHL